jgi:hypothetical protein
MIKYPACVLRPARLVTQMTDLVPRLARTGVSGNDPVPPTRSHDANVLECTSHDRFWHIEPAFLALRSIRDILFPMLSYPTATSADSIERAVTLAAGLGAHIVGVIT